ncbi:adenosine deaminase [Lutimaribacter sp. EGI FJ00015]|uniref:Adenosine deaminase n=1 Tax=Lutimaribacter degradans TaxID=2945989 RepID=A0ACC5ZTT3_9RHOB|nr:adenosine deaminase [Lutimaribacter sp. EGI FJ00013]MCM2561451.1 adenosine deaminase [Lutimaribacter sp. EGI FJ00013]MCO0612839.1 adenosine deaminase [Lutimaribacter sp. EGI FJ00015]MCO0635497.1 adenosine deaminase [Lutimaribacter sp. EGI FJ00014]
MSWQDFPKLELHLHLEGAAPPDFIRRLGQEKSVNLSGVFDERGQYAFRDFAHFLQVYEAATAVLRSPDDYARLISEVLARAAENGVIYTEIFLSPDFCGARDLSAWRDYMAAMQDAAARAEARLGIVMRGIVTCIRHFGPEKARETALCAAETAGDWIVGFGMGGDETRGRQGDFAWAFDCAREAGLRLTTHAGEFAGPASIREALDDLRVDRIGHGVRAIEEPALVSRLVAQGTVLELCPGSNLALGLYPDMRAHPVERLRAAGVKITINTDDPPFFHTDMSREFAALERAHGWDGERFMQVAHTALDAAFCDDATRAALAKRLETPG